MRATPFVLFCSASVLLLSASACRDEPEPSPEPVCAEALLPLQNPRSHTLGETFYLPRLKQDERCPSTLEWQVVSAPEGSRNTAYTRGAPEPRFTPDMPGDYVLRLGELRDSEVPLHVVARSPAERFRNHYLTPLSGVVRVGEELWTANGASYTVSRLARVDGTQWSQQGEVPVGAWPSALAWREPLPYVLVAQRGSDTVGFIDRERGVLVDSLWVGDEPSGLALSPDARRLYVSLATQRRVAVVDLTVREVVAQVEVGFDPRALALSPDGRRLFVASYRSGNHAKDTRGKYGPEDDQDISVVDTASLTTIATVDGVSADLRALALSEDGSELYVAATDGDPEPSQADATAKPFVHEVVVVDADAEVPGVLRRADLTRQAGSGGPVVNPAGVLAVGDTLWVSSESSDVVVALDRNTLAEKARVAVGPGARQMVALDAAGTVAVHCFQSFELWVLRADGTVLQKVKLAEDPRPANVALGERVFTRPGGGFAANHSCSSCHVETQNDGMVWRFGPSIWHNVRPLQLLDATTPLEWGAYVSSSENFGYQGPASIVSRPATPEEALGLQAFLGSLLGAPRATGHTRLDGSYTEAALRGQALFEGKAACSGCHTPPLYTSRGYVAQGKSGEPADIPTLLGTYRHGIYFVGAKARSLEAALEVAIDYVKVPLSAEERADLLAFLRELTPKGGAPMGIWPDIDSDEGVYPDVRPSVAFADPVEDTQGKTAAEVAAEYVVLEDALGNRVSGAVEVQGGRLTFVPAAPLAPGARYRFRVLPGLPFLSGGSLWGELGSEFTVAKPAAGTWPRTMRMTVQVPGREGTAPVDFVLETTEASRPGGLTLTILPQGSGSQQRQQVWSRLDGDRWRVQPFAMPLFRTSVADASEVMGTVTQVDPSTQGITRVEGKLRIRGPGIDMPDVAFSIVPQ
uniref:YVTN family beta-propeller repeat protein n=1 Tax=Cystobacter velatus TaxID=394094 RepID=A0A3Q8I3E9_9BACT|nr:YVTN family beta-propeller repeat protein [Cystobacter velatus]